MAIELIVTSDEGEIKLIEANDEVGINKLEFIYDSSDDSTEKKLDAIKGLKLEGKISAENKSETLELAKWSLYEKGNSVYRKVNVKITDNNEKIIREYDFSAMFVVDYTEKFIAEGKGEFILKLYQKAKNLGIEIFD